MHLTYFGRAIAGVAAVGLATSLLAMPASARTDPAHPDSDASQFQAADQVPESTIIDEMEARADTVCGPAGAQLNSDLVLLNRVSTTWSPNVYLVSADINLDGDTSDYERTCNFAVLTSSSRSGHHEGTYSFTAGSDPAEGSDVSADPDQTHVVSFSGTIAISEPIFTTTDEYAHASFSASGNFVQPSSYIFKRKITEAKPAKQKKAAKRVFNKKIKAAKKAYKKAGKTKKAKKAMNKKIAAAKRAYKKAIVTRRVIEQTVTHTLRAPFVVSGALNGPDHDVRPPL